MKKSLFVYLICMISMSSIGVAQDTPAPTPTPKTPLAIDSETGEVLTNEETLDEAWPIDGTNVILVNPIPPEDGSIEVELDASVWAVFGVGDNEARYKEHWTMPGIIRPVPGREYVIHVRSTGYLPVDKTVRFEPNATHLLIEMQPDPRWIQIADPGQRQGLMRYKDGFAFGFDLYGSEPGYYYNPADNRLEELALSPYEAADIATLPEATLSWLDVAVDDETGIRHPVQVLPSGRRVIYPRTTGNGSFWLADLETHEMVDLGIRFPSYCCRTDFVENGGYAVVWPDEDQFAFDTIYDQISTLGEHGVIVQRFWEYLHLDESYRTFDIEVMAASPDMRYLMLRASDYASGNPFIWFYDDVTGELRDLGQEFDQQAVWAGNDQFIVMTGYQIYRYDVITGGKEYLLNDGELHYRTFANAVLGPGGEWIAVYHPGREETGAGTGILFRRLG